MPKNPDVALRKRIGGLVLVGVLIDRQGTVERTCSTGPSELRAAAESAAVQFRFRRPLINDRVDLLHYIRDWISFRFEPSK